MKSAMRRGEAIHNFHVPLPQDLHRRLRVAADRQGEAATLVARQAIESWLDEQERAAVHEAVAEYAHSAAGTSDDLDANLEAAGIEHLTGKVKKRK